MSIVRAGLHNERQRERRAVPGVRRGAGEAAAPAHPARGGRSPRSVPPRLSRLFITTLPHSHHSTTSDITSYLYPTKPPRYDARF